MNRIIPAVLDQLEAWGDLYDAEADGLTTATDFVDFLRREAPRQQVDIAHRGHRWAAIRWTPLRRERGDTPTDSYEEDLT